MESKANFKCLEIPAVFCNKSSNCVNCCGRKRGQRPTNYFPDQSFVDLARSTKMKCEFRD